MAICRDAFGITHAVGQGGEVEYRVAVPDEAIGVVRARTDAERSQNDRTCCQQHRIYRCEVVILPLQDNECGEPDTISPSQETISCEASREQKRHHAGDPDGGRQGMHQQNLLNQVLPRRENDVTAFGFDVPHQLHKWKVVRHVPDQIWQKYQERHGRSDPDPFVE